MASRLFYKTISSATVRSLQLRSLEKSRISIGSNVLYSTNYDLGNVHNPFNKRPHINHKIEEIEIPEEKNTLYAKDDPDVFGTIDISENEIAKDEGDIVEENFLQNPPKRSQKLSTKQYADMIKEHLQYNRIKEAIDVVEIRMIKEDRVKPENYIYNLLVGGCARAGYSKKAFQLYNKMKQRNLKITGGTYTSLFNACSNTPWLEDGLNKANRLREIMLEKGYTPNVTNYNAMIKAYGRCKDVETAFLLADEMIEKDLNINVDTFNFLIQACASDKDFGFRHVLLIWQKMLNRGISPDIYSFNNLLRCVRDCSIGDIETTEKVIAQILKNSRRNQLKNNETIKLQLDSSQDTNTVQSVDSKNTNMSADLSSDDSKMVKEEYEKSLLITPKNGNSAENITDETPNLLSRNPHLGSLIAISEITKAEDRLLLLGGMKGFLDEMKTSKITPGIETFTLLLDVVPSTTVAEKQIISFIRKIGLKADIDFFNVLIKKRSMRFDYQGAKEVLTMIKTAKLQPNLITYGVLALGCQTPEEANEFLQKMHEKGIRVNIQILGAMLRQGSAQRNFAYVYEIMEITLNEQIKPNEEFLRHLYNFEKYCKILIIQRHPLSKAKYFKQNFKNFQQKLKQWYQEFGIENLKLEDAIKKIKESPNNQFKEERPVGFEDIKNEKLQRKSKQRKYIKKIKPEQLNDDRTESRRIE